MSGTVDLGPFEPLLSQVHEAFLRTGMTIATGESCTGGMLSMLLTAKSGSSTYFLGGVASYSNDAKAKFLAVDAQLIERYGAVSEEVGTAMALAARKITGADIGVGITGIAGPGGATAGKPVGTVWLGIASNDTVCCRNLKLSGNRDEIRFGSAYAALKDIMSILEAR